MAIILGCALPCIGCNEDGPSLERATETSAETETIEPCSKGTYEGDITLTSNEDVAFLTDYTAVEGKLRINGQASDLTPLSCLQHVSESIAIAETSDLTHLKGLEALETAEALNIFYNDSLLSLAALTSFRSAEKDVYVGHNPELRDVALTALTETESLTIGSCGRGDPPDPPPVDEYSGNPMLENLDGLTALTSVRDIGISENANLVSIAGLQPIAPTAPSWLSTFSLSRNPKLDIEHVNEVMEAMSSANPNTDIFTCELKGDDSLCECYIQD